MPHDGASIRLSRLGLAVALLGLAATVGCNAGPDFQPPKGDVPGAWSQSGPKAPAEAVPPSLQDLAHWWSTFNDPELTSLMDRAVRSNLDLAQAEARIRQSRASLGIVAAGAWPNVAANASAVRSRAPGQGSVPGNTTNLFQAGLDATWEMDIFGRVRRNIEASKADVQAAVENRRAVLVTLTAEVALNYVNLRAFQQRIVIARNNLEEQQHSAKITRERFQAGFVSALDSANADALVASTAADIPVLEASAQQTIYSLSILLDLPPAALNEELSETAAIPVGPPKVPLGVPSDLLRRRPDIRQAEAQIHGATARIGVATADLYPNFTLAASGGFRNTQLENWLDWSQRFWSIGPSATWTVFDAGAIKSNIALQQALTDQTLLTYRQTVLTALQDVENALIASTKEQEHRQALTDSVVANRKAVDLSNQLYTQGLGEFLNVVIAERALYVAEDNLVQSNAAVSTDLISLYKALGGGWEGPASASNSASASKGSASR